MSAVAIVVIAVVVIVAVALIYAANRRKHEQRLEDRREVASEHRQEADARRVAADREATAASAHEEYAQDVDPDAPAENRDTRTQG